MPRPPNEASGVAARPGDGRAAPALPHNPALDGLRGVAVLLVMLLHTAHRLPVPESGLDAVAYGMLRLGWAGVDLFFVLSGYLITTILLANRGLPARRYFGSFYARRALRIFPLYFIAVPSMLAALALWAATPPRWTDWLFHVTYTQNVLGLAYPGTVYATLGHTWSLAVEEHFYLVWPLLVFWLPASRLRPVAITVVAAALLLRGTLWWADVVRPIYISTPTRIDAILVGALLALTVATQRRRWMGIGGAALAVFAIAGAWQGELYPRTGFNLTVGLTLMALASAGAVAACTGGDGPRLLRHPLLQRIGRISYGLYLLHLPLFTFVAELLNPHTTALPYLLRAWIVFSVAASIVFVAASATYEGFERRALARKERFAYRAGERVSV